MDMEHLENKIYNKNSKIFKKCRPKTLKTRQWSANYWPQHELKKIKMPTIKYDESISRNNFDRFFHTHKKFLTLANNADKLDKVYLGDNKWNTKHYNERDIVYSCKDELKFRMARPKDLKHKQVILILSPRCLRRIMRTHSQLKEERHLNRILNQCYMKLVQPTDSLPHSLSTESWRRSPGVIERNAGLRRFFSNDNVPRSTNDGDARLKKNTIQGENRKRNLINNSFLKSLKIAGTLPELPYKPLFPMFAGRLLVQRRNSTNKSISKASVESAGQQDTMTIAGLTANEIRKGLEAQRKLNNLTHDRYKLPRFSPIKHIAVKDGQLVETGAGATDEPENEVEKPMMFRTLLHPVLYDKVLRHSVRKSLLPEIVSKHTEYVSDNLPKRLSEAEEESVDELKSTFNLYNLVDMLLPKKKIENENSDSVGSILTMQSASKVFRSNSMTTYQLSAHKLPLNVQNDSAGQDVTTIKKPTKHSARHSKRLQNKIKHKITTGSVSSAKQSKSELNNKPIMAFEIFKPIDSSILFNRSNALRKKKSSMARKSSKSIQTLENSKSQERTFPKRFLWHGTKTKKKSNDSSPDILVQYSYSLLEPLEENIKKDTKIRRRKRFYSSIEKPYIIPQLSISTIFDHIDNNGKKTPSVSSKVRQKATSSLNTFRSTSKRSASASASQRQIRVKRRRVKSARRNKSTKRKIISHLKHKTNLTEMHSLPTPSKNSSMATVSFVFDSASANKQMRMREQFLERRAKRLAEYSAANSTSKTPSTASTASAVKEPLRRPVRLSKNFSSPFRQSVAVSRKFSTRSSKPTSTFRQSLPGKPKSKFTTLTRMRASKPLIRLPVRLYQNSLHSGASKTSVASSPPSTNTRQRSLVTPIHVDSYIFRLIDQENKMQRELNEKYNLKQKPIRFISMKQKRARSRQRLTKSPSARHGQTESHKAKSETSVNSYASARRKLKPHLLRKHSLSTLHSGRSRKKPWSNETLKETGLSKSFWNSNYSLFVPKPNRKSNKSEKSKGMQKRKSKKRQNKTKRFSKSQELKLNSQKRMKSSKSSKKHSSQKHHEGEGKKGHNATKNIVHDHRVPVFTPTRLATPISSSKIYPRARSFTKPQVTQTSVQQIREEMLRSIKRKLPSVISLDDSMRLSENVTPVYTKNAEIEKETTEIYRNTIDTIRKRLRANRQLQKQQQSEDELWDNRGLISDNQPEPSGSTHSYWPKSRVVDNIDSRSLIKVSSRQITQSSVTTSMQSLLTARSLKALTMPPPVQKVLDTMEFGWDNVQTQLNHTDGRMENLKVIQQIQTSLRRTQLLAALKSFRKFQKLRRQRQRPLARPKHIKLSQLIQGSTPSMVHGIDEHAICDCDICKFMKRREREQDSPLIKRLKADRQKQELREYYMNMRHAETDFVENCADGPPNSNVSGEYSTINSNLESTANDVVECYSNYPSTQSTEKDIEKILASYGDDKSQHPKLNAINICEPHKDENYKYLKILHSNCLHYIKNAICEAEPESI